MKYGVYGKALLLDQSLLELPNIENDFEFIDCNSDEDVNYILDEMKMRNHLIDARIEDDDQYEDSLEYESDCFFTALLFTTIYDYWFGFRDINVKKYIISVEYFLLQDAIWDFLKGEIGISELKDTANNFNKVVN